jgi:Ca2+-transporting ATPase
MTPTARETTPAAGGHGLSDAEARQLPAHDGPNELPLAKHRGVLRLTWEVASEPMFLLLVACGAIYMLLGDRQEALMLLCFVFVVMGISLSQQRRSEKSLEALRDLSSPRALVEREGNVLRIAARELVVGDIVGLSVLPVIFGWPMLLMPAHILFLQSIIDPACSIVFEAEPLEADAMKVPPRRQDEQLFDTVVVVRGLWQGAGLLLLLLIVYAGDGAISPTDGSQDDAARALTFVVLVLSNLGLIHVNRSWGRTSWRRSVLLSREFAWIAAGAAILLTAVLTVPGISRLFSFAPPAPGLLLAGLCIAALAMAWFEGVKRFLRSGRSLAQT